MSQLPPSPPPEPSQRLPPGVQLPHQPPLSPPASPSPPPLRQPCPGVHFDGAKAQLSLVTDSPGLPVAGSEVSASGTHSRTFGFFRTAPPGAGGAIAALSGGLRPVAPATFAVGLPLASAAVAVARTTTLYVDRNVVKVVYQLRDAAGNTQVDTSVSRLKVWLTVDHADGRSPRRASCGLPKSSVGSGVGECESLLPREWFGADSTKVFTTVLVEYDGVEAAVASGGAVSLERQPSHPALTSAGMAATMTRAPVYAGDSVEVIVEAHTGPANFMMKLWKATVRYDASVLELKAVDYSSVYQKPIDCFQPKDECVPGEFVTLASGLANGVSPAAATAQTSLYLMKLTFEARTSALQGTYENALSLTVNSMLNEMGARYLSEMPAEIRDMRVGASSAGQLHVVPVRVIAMLGYASSAELANTAVLDGADVRSAVTVLRVLDRPALSPSLAGLGEYACSVSGDVGLVQLSNEWGCTVTTVHDASAFGGGDTSVLVTPRPPHVDAASATVPLRVWQPLMVAVLVEDTTLSRIEGLRVAGACSRLAYQSAKVTAVAVFGGSLLRSVSDVDVSELMQFTGGSSVAVTVSGRTVTGASAGSASVSVTATRLAARVVAASVRVVDEAVTVVELHGSVVTGLEWARLPRSVVPWLPVTERLQAGVRLVQSLRVEGAAGEVQAAVTLSDNSRQQLPPSQLNVQSRYEYLVASADADGGWGVEVAANAQRVCGEMLEVSWIVCNTSVASGTAPVDLQLPVATAVVVQISAGRMTSPDDIASQPPILVSTTSALRVSVTFDDGKTRDFTRDDRVSVAVAGTSAKCVEFVAPSTLEVLPGADCSEVTVIASVTLGDVVLSGRASVPLVRFELLELLLSAYPSAASFSGASTDALTLRRLACTDYFQLAQAFVGARLSDDSLVDVTRFSDVAAAGFAPAEASPGSDAVVGSGAVAVETTAAGEVVVVPRGTGRFSLLATFSSESATATVEAIDDRVDAMALDLQLGELGSGDELSFNREVGTRVQSSVSLSFVDGSGFANVLSLSQFYDATVLVAFSSSVDDVVRSDPTGGFTLLGNHWELVEVRARFACERPLVQDSVRLAANLHPKVGDVDLGRTSGLQYAQSFPGEPLALEMRANVEEAGRLVAFQVDVRFDDSVFEATSCTSGELGGFGCTINDPVDRARLLADSQTSQLGGRLVVLGTLTLRIKTSVESEVSLISAEIVELIRYALGGDDVLGRVYREEMVAGAGYAYVRGATAGRRLSATDERLRLASA